MDSNLRYGIPYLPISQAVTSAPNSHARWVARLEWASRTKKFATLSRSDWISFAGRACVSLRVSGERVIPHQTPAPEAAPVRGSRQ